jgi:hypothetical protein
MPRVFENEEGGGIKKRSRDKRDKKQIRFFMAHARIEISSLW